MALEFKDSAAIALLARMGRDYDNTESAARRVAEHAAAEQSELIVALSDLLDAIDAGDAIDAEEMGETISNARATLSKLS